MPKYKATAYIRLSYTDDHSSESDSVSNQRKLIENFVEHNPDIEVVSEKIDDGYSGIIFDRPAFKEMMQDVTDGNINCVIVKDLSRLGREYIETGRYLRRVFPAYGVRFIAITDSIDTAHDSGDDLAVSVKNIMNEAYCRDISIKTRSSLDVKRRNGDFVGAFPVYGYMKAEDNKNLLVPDPYAARVVCDIFRMRLEGASASKIASELNRLGILSPLAYKKNNGLPYAKKGYADKADCKWSATTIIRILQDETYTGTLVQGKITHENLLGSGKWQTRTVGVILRSEVYTGDLVQGQTKTVDHRQVKADAEEWTVVRDTHEAIISREQFAAVQEILNQTASRAKAREVKAYTPNLLKGKVFCAHCGGSLHRQRNIRKKSDDVYFYHCLSQSRISKDACPGVTIREDALLDMLADMLQDSLDTALGQYTLSLAELPRQAADRAELREKITSRKQEIQRLRSIVRSLYENLVQGVLTKDEYFDYKEKYESRIADLAVEMEQLEDGLRTMDAQAEQHRALEQDAAQIKTDRALTGALIERLIDRIEVSHDKQITVRYRFQSEFETYAEVLEQCRNM